MQFHELLRLTTWSAVEDTIGRHYPDEEGRGVSPGYAIVWEQLLAMSPTDQAGWCLHADPLEDEGHDPEDLPAGEAPAHVYGRQPGDDARYGIGFTPRAEVLGMEMAQQSRYQDGEMVAHLLWEMTWYGFEEADVQAKAEEIGLLAQEVMNQTPEQQAEQQRRSDEFMQTIPDSTAESDDA